MPPLSVRLPDETRQLLDKAAESTHRSRSFLVKGAQERHLSDIVAEQSGGAKKNRLDKLIMSQGVV